VKTGKETKYFGWFLTAFITLLLISNVIAGRLVDINGIILTSAVLFFPLSYVIGDIIPEVYGYAQARKLIWFGALANILMVVIFYITSMIPTPVWFEPASAYNIVLGMVPRVVIFSILAYWAGSFVNAYILAKMKEWMVTWDPDHKHLYLRTIGSTIFGEGVDSTIFIFGVFLFTMPFKAVLTMFIIQWAVKIAIEALMTPITYIVCKKVKELESVDEVGVGEGSYSPFKK